MQGCASFTQRCCSPACGEDPFWSQLCLLVWVPVSHAGVSPLILREASGCRVEADYLVFIFLLWCLQSPCNKSPSFLLLHFASGKILKWINFALSILISQGHPRASGMKGEVRRGWVTHHLSLASDPVLTTHSEPCQGWVNLLALSPCPQNLRCQRRK